MFLKTTATNKLMVVMGVLLIGSPFVSRSDDNLQQSTSCRTFSNIVSKVRQGSWINRKTTGNEKSLGLDLMFSYPESFECRDGRNQHVLFYIRPPDSELELSGSPVPEPSFQLHVYAYNPVVVDGFYKLATEPLSKEELADCFSEIFAEEKNTRVIEVGQTNTALGPSAWATIVQFNEFTGLPVGQIHRAYYIPMSNGRIVQLMFGVLFPVQSSRSAELLGDCFKQLIPSGASFVGLVTALDRTQLYSPDKVAGTGFGTAWFVTRRELITCLHVVSEAKRITAINTDGRKCQVVCVAKDEANDLALLRVKEDGFVCGRPLQINEMPPSSGNDVVAIGYPFADLLGQDPKITQGVISSLQGLMGDSSKLTFSASIQPGNSGGPLLNMKGWVVGVVASSLVDLSSGNDEIRRSQNVNFAIKGEAVRALLRRAHVKEPEAIKPQVIKSATSIFRQSKDAIVFLQTE